MREAWHTVDNLTWENTMIYMHVVDNKGVVIVKARGAEYRSPSMGILQAARLVRYLKALGDEWLAVIRLTRLGIYQVCNS